MVVENVDCSPTTAPSKQTALQAHTVCTSTLCRGLLLVNSRTFFVASSFSSGFVTICFHVGYGWRGAAFRVNTPSTLRDFWTPRYSGQLWPTENLEVALLDHLEEKIPCDVDVDDNEETLMPQMLQKDSRPIQSRANLTHQLIVMSKLGSNINFNDRLCAMRYSSGEQCKMVIKSLRR